MSREYVQQRLAEIEAEQLANPKPPPDPDREKDGRFAPGNAVGVETRISGNVRNQGWQKGQSGNPLGKKPGTKRLLTHAFIKDLANTWRRHGKQVLERLVDENPAALAALASRYVPQDILAQQSDPWSVRVRLSPMGDDAPTLRVQWAGPDDGLPDCSRVIDAERVPDEPAPPERPLVVDMRDAPTREVEPLEQPRPVAKVAPQRAEDSRPRRAPIDYGRGPGNIA